MQSETEHGLFNSIHRKAPDELVAGFEFRLRGHFQLRPNLSSHAAEPSFVFEGLCGYRLRTLRLFASIFKFALRIVFASFGFEFCLRGILGFKFLRGYFGFRAACRTVIAFLSFVAFAMFGHPTKWGPYLPSQRRACHGSELKT